MVKKEPPVGAATATGGFYNLHLYMKKITFCFNKQVGSSFSDDKATTKKPNMQ